MSTGNLKYDEFVKLCDDAGIAADNPEEMEADYRTGAAMADIVSELEKTAATTPRRTPLEALNEMEKLFDILYANEGGLGAQKQTAITLGALVIRFLADFCSDPMDT